MMIDYSGLRKLIKESGYTEFQFKNDGHISNTVLQNIRKGNNVTLRSLERLCLFLGVKDLSVIKFKKDKKKK